MPSVAAAARSQAAGLAMLDSEGEDDPAPDRRATDSGNGSASDDGFDPFDVIRPVENAYSQTGGLTMLSGNLAPKGAVVKTAGVSPKMLKHTGPAVIFESEEDAYNGIVFGKVKAGDVVVIRYEGPEGRARACRRCSPPRRPSRASAWATSAPWSPTAASPAAPPAPRSATSAPRPPSAARSACSSDGDIIEIDIPAGILSVRLSDAGAGRPPREAWKPRPPRFTTGWLARYAKMATSADTGAILKWD